MVYAEYVWIGGNGEMRSKIRVMNQTEKPTTWNYDGSSTGQAEGTKSEVLIKPVRTFSNGTDTMYVLCETLLPDGTPHPTNNRAWANSVFERNKELEPWYGLEQEYFMMNPNSDMPYGTKQRQKQGQFYCSVGAENAFGRAIAEEHMKLCVSYGIKISGINAEVAPGISSGSLYRDRIWRSSLDGTLFPV